MLPIRFTSRPATIQDIPVVVDMLNQTTDNQQIAYFADDLKTEWSTPNFIPEDSIHLVFTDSMQLVGYVEIWDIDNPPLRPTIWGRVHPGFTRHGIGTHLMTWAEERVQQVLPRCPEGLRVVYQCGCDNHHVGTQKLFDNFGLNYYRDSWDMEITLTEEPIVVFPPSEFRIRDYRHPNEFAAVILANEEAFEDHHGYVKKTPEQHLEQWQHLIDTDPHFDPSVWFVAEHKPTGDIAGIAISRTRSWNDPTKAYLGSLSVRRPYRRQGLANVLLHHTFHAFWSRDIPTITLSVDASNLTGATDLYTKAGMYVTRHLMMYEKEIRSGYDSSG